MSTEPSSIALAEFKVALQKDGIDEAALAHVIKDKTEAAYQRGNMFEKRVHLMQEWAEFCGSFA